MKEQWQSILIIELKRNKTTGELFLQHHIQTGLSSTDIYGILQKDICKKFDSANKLKRHANELMDIRSLVEKI